MKNLIISQVQTGGTIGAQKLYGIPNNIYEQIIDLLNNNSTIESGTEIDEITDNENNIKPFKDVKIGDIAHHESCKSPNDEPEGHIVWVGNSDLLKLEPNFVDDLIDENGEDWGDLEEYNQWVVVNVPMYGHTLYNYNIDPSGVKVFK